MCDHIICDSALSKGYGLLEELERKLSASKVRDLELLGYIENAVDSRGETWKQWLDITTHFGFPS